MVIGNYNVTAEIICLIVAVFLFLLMLYSNPRKTRSYTIIFSGVILSIFTIISQIALISASTRTDVFGINTFFFLNTLFLFMYLIILCFIYASICLLSSNTRQHIRYLHYRMLAIALLYTIAAVILFYYNSHISEHFSVDTMLTFYTTAGLIDCVFSYISIIRNHKTIPSVTCKYAVMVYIRDENKVHTFINNVEQIINRNIQKAPFNVNYRMVAFRNKNNLNDPTHGLLCKNTVTSALWNVNCGVPTN